MKKFFILLLIPLFVQTILGCSCVDSRAPIREFYQNSDAVFIGKIERISSAIADAEAQLALQEVDTNLWNKSGWVVVHFKLEKSFKGVDGKTIKVLTHRGTSCQLSVKEGKRWVVYAGKSQKTGFWGFGVCGGSDEIERSSELEKELENLAKGLTPTQIVGRVHKYSGDENIKHVKVTLEGNGVNLTTTLNDSGFFEFSPTQMGKYKVKITVPLTAFVMVRKFVG